MSSELTTSPSTLFLQWEDMPSEQKLIGTFHYSCKNHSGKAARDYLNKKSLYIR